MFYCSLVEFQWSMKKAVDKKYDKYQYAVKFEKMKDDRGGEDYDIYQYKSNMEIATGVQIRFFRNQT